MSSDIFILSLTNLNLFCCVVVLSFYAIPHLVCGKGPPRFLMFPIIIRRLLPVLSEVEKETDAACSSWDPDDPATFVALLNPII